MSEELIPVNTFVAQYKCPNCSVFMKFSGVVLTSNPPQYPHVCPDCGHKETLRKSYPAIIRKKAAV